MRPDSAPTRSRPDRCPVGSEATARRAESSSSGTRVAGSADASVSVDVAALVGHRCDADVTGQLPAVVERAVEDLAREDGGKVTPDAPDAAQSGDLATGLLLWLDLCRRIALGFDLTDLFQSEHELPAEAIQFGLELTRHLTSITGAQGSKIPLP